MTVMRPLIDQALEKPQRDYPQTRRLGRVTLDRLIKDCQHWTEVEDINGPFVQPEKPWNPAQALERLNVRQVPFDQAKDPRWDAYAEGRTFAIAPDVARPLRALMHELAHIELGHTYMATRGGRSRPLREVQAEVVAHAALALIGAVEVNLLGTCQDYIDRWSARLTEPLTDENIDQMGHAINEVVIAGR